MSKQYLSKMKQIELILIEKTTSGVI